MNKKTTLSTLSLAVLGLIQQEPRSGYDLRKIFSTTPMGHFSTSPGAIYPALKRIEKSGWIRGNIDNNKELQTPENWEAICTLTKFMYEKFPYTTGLFTGNKNDIENFYKEACENSGQTFEETSDEKRIKYDFSKISESFYGLRHYP